MNSTFFFKSFILSFPSDIVRVDVSTTISNQAYNLAIESYLV